MELGPNLSFSPDFAKRIGHLPNGAVIDASIARLVAWHGGEKWRGGQGQEPRAGRRISDQVFKLDIEQPVPAEYPRCFEFMLSLSPKSRSKVVFNRSSSTAS